MRSSAHTRSAASHAFTLIELLIVIGLITLVTTWVIFNQTGIGLNFTRLTPEEVFRLAVREARYQAQIKNSTVTLSWDAEAQTFLFFNAGAPIEINEKILPLDRLSLEGKLALIFRPKLPTKRINSLSTDDVEAYGPETPLLLEFSPYGVGSEGKIDFLVDDAPRSTLSLEAFSSYAPPESERL